MKTYTIKTSRIKWSIVWLMVLSGKILSQPDIHVTPPSLDFGNVPVGIPVSQTLVVSNAGNTALDVTSTGLNSGVVFSIVSGGSPFTLSPGGFHIIEISFTPDAEGQLYDNLSLESNDPDENPLDVLLSGSGILPEIRIVQPFYDVPLAMYIAWSPVNDVNEYQIRRDTDGSGYGAWNSAGLNTVFNDNLGITAGPTYSYQVRIRIGSDFSEPSNPRSSRAVKIWPVTQNSSCTAPESHELLHGINQSIFASNFYLHEGIDIQGGETTQSECVRAPLGGVIRNHGGSGSDISVSLRVRINGEYKHISFNHLENLNPNLVDETSIAPGERLGSIYSGSDFGNSRNKHTHFHLNGPFSDINGQDSTTANPLTLFDTNELHDPQMVPPEVRDTNGDSEPLRFRRGPDEPDYLPDDDLIYGPVDIVVEGVDRQSSDAPWQVPNFVGYYIQKVEGSTVSDVVRSSAEPYLLIDGTRWFGTPFHNTPYDRMTTLFDDSDDLKSAPPNTPAWYYWEQWFTYIVTNTTSIVGDSSELDRDQCWASNAQNTVSTPNGYETNYARAIVNEEAKFPDGDYRVRIFLADLVNSPAEDYSHDVVVDNFRPYVKEVKITNTNGNVLYSARWSWNGSVLQLSPADPDNGIIAPANVTDNVIIKITGNEPLSDVDITIESLSYLATDADAVSPDSTEWTFMIPEAIIADDGSDNDVHIISINGTDKAGNSLEGYTEATNTYSATQIPQRDGNGFWDPPPHPGTDRVHRFLIGPRNMDVALLLETPTDPASTNLPSVKNAANQFISMMGPGDNLVIIGFDDTPTVYGAGTIVNEGSIQIAQQSVNSIPNGIHGASIGAAIQRAQQELQAFPNRHFPQVMILFDNGFEGVEPYAEEIVPYIPEETDIYTLTVRGRIVTGVNLTKLANIAVSTGGLPFGSGDPEELPGHIRTIFLHLTGEEVLASPSGQAQGGSKISTVITHDVFVDGSLQNANFSLFWQNSASDLDLELVDPQGITIDSAFAAGDPNITFNSYSTNEFYRVDSPDSGQWTLRVTGVTIGGGGAEPYQVSVAGHSSIELDIAFAGDNYLEQDTVIINAILTEENLPLPGAALNAGIISPADPLNADSLVLFDDGAHGDGAPADGVYGNFYTSTNSLGGYNVSVSAAGTSASAGPFTRQSSHTFAILPPPEIVVSLDTLDFGEVVEGQSSVRKLAISNFAYNAAANLRISAQTTDPAFQALPAELSIWDTYSDTLAITFSPASAGAFEAQLLLHTNDPDESNISIELRGTGLAALPNITVSDAGINFGGIASGESITDTLVIGNAGYALLTVSDISSDDPHFTVNTANFTVNPGENREVIITFSPDAVAFFSGTLTIESNDPDEPVSMVTLQGEGQIPPEIAVSPASFTESLLSGQLSTQMLTIENSGVANLRFKIAMEDVPAATAMKVKINPSAARRALAQPAAKREALESGNPSARNYSLGAHEPSAGAAPVSNKTASKGSAPRMMFPALSASPNAFGTELIWDMFCYFDPVEPQKLNTIAAFSDQIYAGDFGAGDQSFAYAINQSSGNFVKIDTLTGAQTVIAPLSPLADPANETFTGMDYNFADGKMYVSSCISPAAASILYEINLETGALTLVGSDNTAGACIIALASDPDGNLYGPDIINDNLYRIDRTSGALTEIGPLGFDANFAQGADYDYKTGNLYLTAFNNFTLQAELRIVDIHTGNATLVETLGSHVPGSPVQLGWCAWPGWWLSGNPVSGIIPGNSSLAIEVTFDATGLSGGDYDANMLISNNDPDEPEVSVPAFLQVTGAPDISLSEEILDYGRVINEVTVTDTLVISNLGSGVLAVSDISSDHPAFTVGAGNFTLNRHQHRRVAVTFSPSAPGIFNGTLTIASNDPDEPNVTVALAGERFDPVVQDTTFILASPMPEAFGQFGRSVSGAGDVNNDGVGDVIIGALFENGGAAEAGRAYIFSGADGSPLDTLISPNPKAGGGFGSSVAGIGDINNDGRGDVIVGAPRENVSGEYEAGRAYIFSGAGGGLLRTLTLPVPQPFYLFGSTVSGLKDVNGDGVSDIVVGTQQAKGRVYIFSGLDGSLLHTLQSPSPEPADNLGGARGIDDVNGDGRGDVIAGVPTADGGSGRAYIFSGADGSLLHTLASPNPQLLGGFGWSVSGVPDLNFDGRGDVVIGASGQNLNGEHRAYIFSGVDGRLLITLGFLTPSSHSFAASVSGLDDVNHDERGDVLVEESLFEGGNAYGNAYIFSGADGTLLDSLFSENTAPYGLRVSGAGDINGDGIGDMVAGAGSADHAGLVNSGKAYIFIYQPPPAAPALTADLGFLLPPYSPPETFIYGDTLIDTLRIVNHGPHTAAGVTVVDTLPAGVRFISARKIQGPPVVCREEDGVITWDGGFTLLSLFKRDTLIIELKTIAETLGLIRNIPWVRSNTTDTDLDNNSGFDERFISGLLEQPRDNYFGAGQFSDADCEACTWIPSRMQAVAENFILPGAYTIGKIVIAGSYSPGTTLPEDDFTVIFRQNNDGLPGSVFARRNRVPGNRIPAGDGFQFTLELDNPVRVAAEATWVEIFNNTEGSSESFMWQTGVHDPVYGLPNSAKAPETPGVSWSSEGFLTNALAIQLLPTHAPADTADVKIMVNAPQSVVLGNTVSYTIGVINAGPDSARTVLFENFLSGVTINSLNVTGANCQAVNNNLFTCEFDVIAPGDTVMLNIEATCSSLGVLTNNACVPMTNSDDIEPGNNCDITNINIVSAITFLPNSVEVTVTEGDSAVESLLINNNGATNLAYSIAVQPGGAALLGAGSPEKGGGNMEDRMSPSFAGEPMISAKGIHNDLPESITSAPFLGGTRVMIANRTLGGFYATFETRLVENGAEVTIYQGVVDAATLDTVDVLVIADDLDPSAAEVTVIHNWVIGGGRLMIDGGLNSVDDRNDYNNILSGSGITYLSPQLANQITTNITPHPVTEGITSYQISGGRTLSVSGNAISVIRNLAGTPYSAVAALGAGRVVVIGAGSLRGFTNTNMLGHLPLGLNAVAWLGKPWLTVFPTAGAIAAGASEDITLTFRSGSLSQGTYNAILAISFNDPFNSLLQVPASLTIVPPDTPRTFIKTVQAGWNMLGLPYLPEDRHYLSVFPGAIENSFFGFNNSYFNEDSFEVGAGYWLRFSEPQSAPVTGRNIESCVIPLNQDWNMISGISCSLDIGEVSDPQGIIVPGTLFRFTNSYQQADSIKQGEGYWIRASAAGEIELGIGNGVVASGNSNLTPALIARHQTPSAASGGRLNKLPAFAKDLIDLDQYAALHISDASGAAQILYYKLPGDTAAVTSAGSLPPISPAGAFDVRFTGDSFISEEEEAVISIQSSHYPLIIRADNLAKVAEYQYVLTELLGGEEGETYLLRNGQPVEIARPHVKTLKLGKMERLVPAEFRVHQNYPNPFNPNTTIKYDLPEAGPVTLEIYNLLGQKIRTLVSDHREAGYHQAPWDGTNDAGTKVGSGMFFYRLVAGDYTAVRKMLLLK